MSIAELKKTAEKLTAKERAWLKAYLCAKERASDPAWKAEMARRRKRMLAGNGVTEAEYRRRTRTLSKRTSRPASKWATDGCSTRKRMPSFAR